MIRVIIFSLLFVGSNLFPEFAEAVVCQNKTLVVYSNGIDNERFEAKFSLEKLEGRLNTYPQASPLLPFEYTLAYARDKNPYTDPITGVVTDGVWGQWYEVTRQIRADRASVFWRWAAADPATPQAFRDEQLRIAAQINLQAYTNDADLTGHLDNIYRPSLAQGKRVLIVAHSQGNLYANAAYDRLLLDGTVGPTKNHLGIVAVASPASFVNGNNGNAPHVTAFEDLVILGVGQNYSLNPLPGTHSNLGDSFVNDLSGHNFVKYYLAGSQTRVAILNHIVTTVEGTNGVGGLEYPKQGCTVTLPPAIPQPGPYYYRDDWGFPIPEEVGTGSSTFVPTPVKHLRDDAKGIAYTVRFVPFSSSGSYALSEWGVSITIADYINNTRKRLPTFALSSVLGANLGRPVPNVLLWSGGLLLLDSGHHSWRKITINDGGVGTFPRWSVAPIQDGVITYPTYPWVVREIVSPPGVHWTLKKIAFKQWAGNGWTRLGIAYQVGPYDYRIPFSATRATWTNYPTGIFPAWGAVLPTPAVITFQGEYGVLDITDGNISFVKLGSVPLKIATGGAQVGPKPVITNYGVDASMAYIRTQPFLDPTGLATRPLYWQPSYSIDKNLNETALPVWQAKYSYGAGIFNAGGTLLADLPNTEGFFMPPWRNMRYLRFQASSLSDKMAVMFDKGYTGMYNSAALAKSYKLGNGYMIVSDDPMLQQLNPPITFPWFYPATNPILLSPEQKAFLESP